jgi:hypothetical protein
MVMLYNLNHFLLIVMLIVYPNQHVVFLLIKKQFSIKLVQNTILYLENRLSDLCITMKYQIKTSKRKIFLICGKL